MVIVEDDFHPAESARVVLGEFETNVFRFVHREEAVVFIKKDNIGAHESVVIAETVVGIIGKKRDF